MRGKGNVDDVVFLVGSPVKSALASARQGRHGKPRPPHPADIILPDQAHLFQMKAPIPPEPEALFHPAGPLRLPSAGVFHPADPSRRWQDGVCGLE